MQTARAISLRPTSWRAIATTGARFAASRASDSHEGGQVGIRLAHSMLHKGAVFAGLQDGLVVFGAALYSAVKAVTETLVKGVEPCSMIGAQIESQRAALCSSHAACAVGFPRGGSQCRFRTVISARTSSGSSEVMIRRFTSAATCKSATWRPSAPGRDPALSTASILIHPLPIKAIASALPGASPTTSSCHFRSTWSNPGLSAFGTIFHSSSRAVGRPWQLPCWSAAAVRSALL